MRELSNGCLAGLVVFLALLFGSGGGCFVGGLAAPPSRDWLKNAGWATNGAVIGAGVV